MTKNIDGKFSRLSFFEMKVKFSFMLFYVISQGHDPPDVQAEREIRMEISSIIQLILVALNSAYLSLPASRWYVQELFKVQEKAAQFKVTMRILSVRRLLIISFDCFDIR